MKNKYLPLVLLVAGAGLRLLPHAPNVAPIGPIALFAGSHFSRWQALAVTLGALLISDLFLGSHPTIAWVYGSYALIALLGSRFKASLSPAKVLGLSLTSSLIFFAISNFGVWVTTDSYSKDLVGLLECYTLALPFFRNTLIGDVLYSIIIFGGYYFSQCCQSSATSGRTYSSRHQQIVSGVDPGFQKEQNKIVPELA